MRAPSFLEQLRSWVLQVRKKAWEMITLQP